MPRKGSMGPELVGLGWSEVEKGSAEEVVGSASWAVTSSSSWCGSTKVASLRSTLVSLREPSSSLEAFSMSRQQKG